jgi:hypothetical protein
MHARSTIWPTSASLVRCASRTQTAPRFGETRGPNHVGSQPKCQKRTQTAMRAVPRHGLCLFVERGPNWPADLVLRPLQAELVRRRFSLETTPWNPPPSAQFRLERRHYRYHRQGTRWRAARIAAAPDLAVTSAEPYDGRPDSPARPDDPEKFGHAFTLRSCSRARPAIVELFSVSQPPFAAS